MYMKVIRITLSIILALAIAACSEHEPNHGASDLVPAQLANATITPTTPNSSTPPLQGGGARSRAEGAREVAEGRRGLLSPLPRQAGYSPLAGGELNGSVKTQFAPDDIITLHYHHGALAKTTDFFLTDNNVWNPTNPDEGDLYINAQPTGITATYLADEEPDVNNGITTYPDKLQATALPLQGGSTPQGGGGIDLTTTPATITLVFGHTQALLQLGTIEAASEPGSLALKANEPIRAELDNNTTVALTGTPACAIIPPTASVEAIHFTLANGMQYTALPLQGGSTGAAGEGGAGEGGKRLTINITLTGQTATIDPTTSDDITPWGEPETGRPLPEGYDRAIYNEEDLIAFRDAVNADRTGTGASKAKVYQMADIILTGEAWTEAIGNASTGRPFTGTYNGGGFSISGLKVTVDDFVGLFGTTNGATLTGIHLRGVEVSGSFAGALVGDAQGATTISLCSATGRVTATSMASGLVGGLNANCLVLRSRATCTVRGTGTYVIASGLVGVNEGTILGCMAGGSVSGDGLLGGVAGFNALGKIYHSYSIIDTGDASTCVAGTGDNAYSSYGVGQVFDANGALTDITAGNPPGPIVSAGNHQIGDITYVGTKIWTTDDYPTLKYSYEGEK